MKYWLIGCGVLLVIALILGGFGVYYLVQKGQEVGEKLQAVAADYDRLETEYPFAKPADGILKSDLVARCVSVRSRVYGSFKKWKSRIEDEEASFWDRATSVVDMIPALAQSHVDALTEVKLGPTEYLWCVDQILLVLRYAEIPEFPEKLKAQLPPNAHDELRKLRQRYDNMLSEQEGGPAFGDANQQDPTSLLPAVDPSIIDMPAQNIQSVLDHAEGIGDTVNIFFLYDLHFKNTYRSITQEAARNRRAAAKEGPKEGSEEGMDK